MIIDLHPAYLEFMDLLKRMDWYAIETPHHPRHIQWLFGPGFSGVDIDTDRSSLTILHAVDGEEREHTFTEFPDHPPATRSLRWDPPDPYWLCRFVKPSSVLINVDPPRFVELSLTPLQLNIRHPGVPAIRTHHIREVIEVHGNPPVNHENLPAGCDEPRIGLDMWIVRSGGVWCRFKRWLGSTLINLVCARDRMVQKTP